MAAALKDAAYTQGLLVEGGLTTGNLAAALRNMKKGKGAPCTLGTPRRDCHLGGVHGHAVLQGLREHRVASLTGSSSNMKDGIIEGAASHKEGLTEMAAALKDAAHTLSLLIAGGLSRGNLVAALQNLEER